MREAISTSIHKQGCKQWKSPVSQVLTSSVYVFEACQLGTIEMCIILQTTEQLSNTQNNDKRKCINKSIAFHQLPFIRKCNIAI